MIKKLTVLAAGGLLFGSAHAQQFMWPPLPPVPVWVVPGTMQPLPAQLPPQVPPQFLLPQNVPFPTPFWFWYAPPPGVEPFVKALPTAPLPRGAEVKEDTGKELKNEKPVADVSAPSPSAVVKDAVSAPEPAQPRVAEPAVPVAAEAPTPPAPTVAQPEPEKLPQEAARPPEPPILAKPAPETPPEHGSPAAASPAPTTGPAPVLAAPAKAPVAGPKVRSPDKTGVQSSPTGQPAPETVAAKKADNGKPKSVKKSRKLCWKDGRLDVCE